jgi:DNA-binding transcriptional regulator YhcF (GntR family)
MLNENNFETRDIKNGDWYWVNKSIIFDHANKIKANGIMVYSFLACHADKKQSCFPSQKYISEKLGCSRATVSRTLKELESNGLIRTERLDKYHCAYHLLKVGCPEMKSSEQDDFTGETHMTRNDTSEFHQSYTNYNDLLKDINNIDIVSVKNSDKGIIPLTREEFIAYDLAESLNDSENINRYLSYTKRLPESFLRGILGDVMEIPDEKIRKSRAALFNHIINKHISKHAGNNEDNRD